MLYAKVNFIPTKMVSNQLRYLEIREENESTGFKRSVNPRLNPRFSSIATEAGAKAEGHKNGRRKLRLGRGHGRTPLVSCCSFIYTNFIKTFKFEDGF